MQAPPRRFLTAQWRNLVMLNYEVPEDLLRPLVPQGTSLDLWEGQALVSIVGFMFLDTRVMGISVPFHRHFAEVNLRFYVKRDTTNDVKRGVVFIKEVVPLAAITFVARWLYNENYFTRRMTSEFHEPSGDELGNVSYGWRESNGDVRVQAEFGGEASFPNTGSEAEFITEHYWGYAKQRDDSTMEYEVTHPQWQVWQADSSKLEGEIANAYGSRFSPYLTRTPRSSFVAVGSEIEVYAGRKIE